MGAYRSKAPIVVQKKKAKPLLRNGEKAGLVLGAVLLVFSFIEGDVPLAFFLLSFFLYEISVVAEKIAEKRMHQAVAFLRGLSVALCIGSLCMIFT